MYTVTFQFKTEDEAKTFLAVMCDGGGEVSFMDLEEPMNFDYTDAWSSIGPDYSIDVY